jgi:hypothetical protein
MSNQLIYDKLRAAGLTHNGVCGVMGNLMAESSMIANIAQRGMTKLTDAEYTAKFDDYPTTCYRDGVGYGLAQWTFWSRKQELFEFANAKGTSVGDEATQVDFVIHELRKDYSGLFSFLCETNDLYAATDRVCREYERPAINNVDRRYSFAKIFSEDLAPTEAAIKPAEEKWFPPDISVLVLQAVLVGNGYPVEVTGYKDEKFLATMREFLKDMGG